MKDPNPIIMIPPIWFSPEIKLAAELDNTLFRITPKTEKITENHRTKNTVFIKILSLFETRFTVPLFRWSSVIVVPDMYATNAGITGNIQGAKNDPKPAIAAIATDISGINLNWVFFY